MNGEEINLGYLLKFYYRETNHVKPLTKNELKNYYKMIKKAAEQTQAKQTWFWYCDGDTNEADRTIWLN
jgi:diadenosine tetraphosphate (Ap4A) HIT family hydrolase